MYMRREWQRTLLVSGLLALPFVISSWNALFAPNAQWITPTGCYFGLDFVNFWSAGRLAVEGLVTQGYDPAAYKAILAQWFAPLNFTNLSYPPSLLVLLAPLSLLPYFAAYALWQIMGASAFVYAAIGRKLQRSDAHLVAALLIAPVLYSNFVFGQIALYMAALFVGALRALPARPVLAGVLFGLLTVKPQLGVLIPVFLLAIGAWRTIAAASVTALALFAVSALCFGLEPWHAYVTDTTRLQWSYIMAMNDFYAVHMMTPYAALWSVGVPIPQALQWQWIITAAIVVVTAIVARGSAPWPLKSAILAVGTVLAVPYSLAHDLAVPLVAIVWYLSTLEEKPSWPALMVVGALWMLPFPLSFILQIKGIPATQVLLAAVYAGLVIQAVRPKTQAAFDAKAPQTSAV